MLSCDFQNPPNPPFVNGDRGITAKLDSGPPGVVPPCFGILQLSVPGLSKRPTNL